MRYNECKICGATLDPNEKCICANPDARRREEIEAVKRQYRRMGEVPFLLEASYNSFKSVYDLLDAVQNPTNRELERKDRNKLCMNALLELIEEKRKMKEVKLNT